MRTLCSAGAQPSSGAGSYAFTIEVQLGNCADYGRRLPPGEPKLHLSSPGWVVMSAAEDCSVASSSIFALFADLLAMIIS